MAVDGLRNASSREKREIHLLPTALQMPANVDDAISRDTRQARCSFRRAGDEHLVGALRHEPRHETREHPRKSPSGCARGRAHRRDSESTDSLTSSRHAKPVWQAAALG